jgi:hypothetical protein
MEFGTMAMVEIASNLIVKVYLDQITVCTVSFRGEMEMPIVHGDTVECKDQLKLTNMIVVQKTHRNLLPTNAVCFGVKAT